MTHEELTAEVAGLRTMLFAVGELAKTLAGELKVTNEGVEFMLDQLNGTSYAQDVVIHALMVTVVRDNDLNQQRFLNVFNSGIESRRAQMTPNALQNFDTTVNSARQMFEAFTA